MRRRKSARLLILNPSHDVLLFRFIHKQGPLTGNDYWATPGGGVEEGETFEDAAVRELQEETGIVVNHVGPAVARREVKLQFPDGEYVVADECYFAIETATLNISCEGWTRQEQQIMAAPKWWSLAELRETVDTVWPENLVSILEAIPEGQTVGTRKGGSTWRAES